MTRNHEAAISPQAHVARCVCVVAFLAAVLTIMGGHPLTPFKTMPWVQTSKTTMTLWGVCPKDVQKTDLISYSPQWASMQTKCTTIFTGPDFTSKNEVEAQYIDFGRRVSVTGLHVFAFIFAFIAFFISFCGHVIPATALSLTAFIFQGVGFALATFEFNRILREVQRTDSSASFAPGLFISGGLSVTYILIANLFYMANKHNRGNDRYAKETNMI